MSNQWEDDDFFDGDEETDMGDELPAPTPQPVTVAVQPEAKTAPIRYIPSPPSERPSARERPSASKGKRTVRVRPMSPGMQAKWPDVVSCLLTLSNGKQVMFVKGG